MLTIFFGLYILDPVSYIWKKYSDFRQFGFYKIFQILPGIRYNKFMGILDNLENSWDDEFFFDNELYKPELQNLSQKLFSDIVCAECESKPMVDTDNMGREKFWEDLGRP